MMAGSDSLRNYAILGAYDDIKALLSGGGNPLGADSSGLNSLHYVVWNGHIDCLKLLLANDMGVNEEGKKESCINSQSELGYTALHVAALEGMEAYESIKLLLLAGADPTKADVEGNTPEDLASEAGQGGGLGGEAAGGGGEVECGGGGDDGPLGPAAAAALQEELRGLVVRRRLADRTSERRAPVIPKELEMDEDLIRPYANENAAAGRREGAQVLRNLVHAVDQSQKNERRRDHLANSLEHDLRARGLM